MTRRDNSANERLAAPHHDWLELNQCIATLGVTSVLALLLGCPTQPPTDLDLAVPDMATPHDTGQIPPDLSFDAGDGWPTNDAGAIACTAEDADAWRERHASSDFLRGVLTCRELCVDGATCEVAGCLVGGAGAVSCLECVIPEVSCGLAECATECGEYGTATACRHCLCEQRCAQQFEACAPAGVGATSLLCADCVDGDCGPRPLSPALIMTVVQ